MRKSVKQKSASRCLAKYLPAPTRRSEEKYFAFSLSSLTLVSFEGRSIAYVGARLGCPRPAHQQGSQR